MIAYILVFMLVNAAGLHRTCPSDAIQAPFMRADEGH